MTSWTERYLAAALRSIPDPKRADLERELRSSIADAVEERVAAGEDRLAAERAVLEGLGDPAQLAAAYTGRPTYLIGPELFPLYRQFVPRLIAVVVPLAAVVMAAVELAGGGSYSDAIAAGISGAISVTIQIAFWATVTFVFLEWADSARKARTEIVSATGRWTLERLPDLSGARVTAKESVGEIVTVLITIGGLLFLRGLGTTDASGSEVPLFAPAFTDFWFPALLAVLAAMAVLHVMVFIVGRWTMALAVGHAALRVAFALPLIVLALNGTLVNPAFAAQIGWPSLAEATGSVTFTPRSLSSTSAPSISPGSKATRNTPSPRSSSARAKNDPSAPARGASSSRLAFTASAAVTTASFPESRIVHTTRPNESRVMEMFMMTS